MRKFLIVLLICAAAIAGSFIGITFGSINNKAKLSIKAQQNIDNLLTDNNSYEVNNGELNSQPNSDSGELKSNLSGTKLTQDEKEFVDKQAIYISRDLNITDREENVYSELKKEVVKFIFEYPVYIEYYDLITACLKIQNNGSDKEFINYNNKLREQIEQALYDPEIDGNEFIQYIRSKAKFDAHKWLWRREMHGLFYSRTKLDLPEELDATLSKYIPNSYTDTVNIYYTDKSKNEQIYDYSLGHIYSLDKSLFVIEMEFVPTEPGNANTDDGYYCRIRILTDANKTNDVIKLLGELLINYKNDLPIIVQGIKDEADDFIKTENLTAYVGVYNIGNNKVCDVEIVPQEGNNNSTN